MREVMHHPAADYIANSSNGIGSVWVVAAVMAGRSTAMVRFDKSVVDLCVVLMRDTVDRNGNPMLIQMSRVWIEAMEGLSFALGGGDGTLTPTAAAAAVREARRQIDGLHLTFGEFWANVADTVGEDAPKNAIAFMADPDPRPRWRRFIDARGEAKPHNFSSKIKNGTPAKEWYRIVSQRGIEARKRAAEERKALGIPSQYIIGQRLLPARLHAVASGYATELDEMRHEGDLLYHALGWGRSRRNSVSLVAMAEAYCLLHDAGVVAGVAKLAEIVRRNVFLIDEEAANVANYPHTESYIRTGAEEDMARDLAAIEKERENYDYAI